MAYEKQDWQNGEGGGTPITAARLRHMETQYETLVDDLLDPQSVPGAALSATMASTVAVGAPAREVFRPKDNGATPPRVDSGHLARNYQNAPGNEYTISGGLMVHSLGQPDVPSAAYRGVQLADRVKRIWADIIWPGGANTHDEVLTLIVSLEQFARPTFADAACHFVIGRSNWSFEKLDADPFGTTQLAAGDFATDLPRGELLRLAIEFDGEHATIYLPDGSIASASDARIFDWRGAHATIESYAFTGTNLNPLGIAAWGAS